VVDAVTGEVADVVETAFVHEGRPPAGDGAP
jgi:hypothetical protein